MSAYHENLIIFLTVSPLFFFIIAVSFRLLDNSALLFLQKDILVTSANVSVTSIKNQINKTDDKEFKEKLRLALLYRRLHRTCLILMLLSIPLMFTGYFML
ncbi:hypothetical protein [Salegentibacter salegens]|uniref:Uncharacterized protein n=1 Tax=Salegentibacter salegens TaxID=143223 RepID=A0A1M7M2D1_9FLAO|nr:hypothetical protein [Salegentibacter salegens]PRX44473.1 hypothetical protein LY58_02090 [Salegentibacter salegens]SHM84329.1 hypothetical protein SAMN05878281_2222 [Salegentibacter salegens]